MVTVELCKIDRSNLDLHTVIFINRLSRKSTYLYSWVTKKLLQYVKNNKPLKTKEIMKYYQNLQLIYQKLQKIEESINQKNNNKAVNKIHSINCNNWLSSITEKNINKTRPKQTKPLLLNVIKNDKTMNFK